MADAFAEGMGVTHVVASPVSYGWYEHNGWCYRLPRLVPLPLPVVPPRPLPALLPLLPGFAVFFARDAKEGPGHALDIAHLGVTETHLATHPRRHPLQPRSLHPYQELRYPSK